MRTLKDIDTVLGKNQEELLKLTSDFIAEDSASDWVELATQLAFDSFADRIGFDQRNTEKQATYEVRKADLNRLWSSLRLIYYVTTIHEIGERIEALTIEREKEVNNG